mmetsp:Transcript_44974/g.106817  ORF Transcript_44974/g.106817 Transcript_44974/m.106817 type:complete len:1019 (+) Transcript_44974:65-3121(+)
MPLQKLSAAARGAPTTAAVHTADSSKQQELLLPGESAAISLAEASSSSGASRPGKLWRQPETAAQGDEEKCSRVYRWTEFYGKEQVTEFPESHFELDGHFESNSSAGHKEFQDRMRAIHFRREGKQKAEIAKIIGRSEKFVAKWWQKEEKEVPRPWGVHEYLSKELGQQTFQKHQNLADIDERISTSTASWWRDVEVKRKFHVDPAIYEELLHNSDWKSSVARTRDFSTGASHVRYDKEGKVKLQSNQGAKYKQGQSPAMDKLLQKFFAVYGLADRTSGILLNWYPDGDAALGSHRHDCWTALFSFGAERILTIDKTPLLCQDGDLVIFGTQRHGVPFMPEVSEGRITVPIFFYPDHLQMKKQWQTLTDPEDPRASRALVEMEKEQTLNSSMWNSAMWSDPSRAATVAQIVQLGFGEDMVRAALVAQKFDAERAVETLLMAGAGKPEEFPELFGSSSSPRAVEVDSDDAAMAMRLQMESEQEQASPSSSHEFCCGGAATTDDDLAAALAVQLAEEELPSQDPDLLQAQFQEYEQQFLHDAAEEWHGHGDLMQSAFARSTLTLDNMDKTTCYSLGHGRLLEKDFYELLSLHSIRVLYDFRASDYRGEVYSPSKMYTVRALKSSCKARGIQYKHVALGRESAYGILKHISTDEAQHALVELVWHAKRRHAAFLGFEEDWRLDHRQVIAEELRKVGHTVQHINHSGGLEEHALPGGRFPDFIQQEEEKLRKLEKMRQAGELKRAEKSSVDRSTEAIASRLDRPAEVIDAMDELRAAGNQRELVQVQRKLARVQRVAEKKMDLANKVLENTPQWILEEAKEQEAWIQKKKAEKAGNGTAPGGKAVQEPPQGAASSSTAASSSSAPVQLKEEELLVECSGCLKQFPWTDLAGGDGRCSACCSSAVLAGGEGSAGATAGSGGADEELLVQCSECETLTPWSILALGDGLCPRCSQQHQEQELTAGSKASYSITTGVAGGEQPLLSQQATPQQAGEAGVANASSWRRRRQEAREAATAAAATACG